MNIPKRIHVIGICGVATSALAIAFHKSGSRVTGSDKGFFPPISTELEKQGVPYYAGWHPEKMVENGIPEVIIVGTASGSQNPETAYAREHGIRTFSFAEAIGEYFTRENSIVCAGTWGKTSSSALLSFIMENAGFDPSYMFGGVSLSHDSSAKLAESDWSVFEGDEYKSSPTDTRAKFFHYKPTHVLLSAVSWDHADLYPTEASYFEAFRKLMGILPGTGFVVACRDNEGVTKTLERFTGKTVLYGKTEAKSGNNSKDSSKPIDYSYSQVVQSEKGLKFVISHGNDSWDIKSPMIGAYQAENITGCFAMALELGVKPNQAIAAIAKFQGLKRRLEKRSDGDIKIIDDIAHSPEKASSVLKTLREIYKGKIITIFEPNSGGRSRESAAKYDNAFKDSDIVIIPRLTKLKVAEDKAELPMEGDELADTIAKTHSNVKYIDDDSKLVESLVAQTKKGDIIAFLGSHGFRGMIEETVKNIK